MQHSSRLEPSPSDQARRIWAVAALAALVWIAATAAEATTFATAQCFNTVVTQQEQAQCLETRVVGSTPGVEARALDEALADLRTGTLRSRAVGVAYQFGSQDFDASALGSARLVDTITIGGGFTGTVELRMEVSGAFLASDPSFPSGGSFVSALLTMFNAAGSASERGVNAQQLNNSGGPFLVELLPPFTTGNGTIQSNVGPTGFFADPADIRIVLTTSLAVTPSNPTFTFSARLGTSATANRLADTNGELKTSEVNFGNSAFLSLIVPAGVPWTSESGVFLQAVPEPGAGALLAAGLLGLVCMGRARAPRAR